MGCSHLQIGFEKYEKYLKQYKICTVHHDQSSNNCHNVEKNQTQKKPDSDALSPPALHNWKEDDSLFEYKVPALFHTSLLQGQ